MTAPAEITTLRSWLAHWDEDRACGLSPTASSLAEAREALARVEDALVAAATDPLRDGLMVVRGNLKAQINQHKDTRS